jgi:hypothetical protein
MMQNSEISHDFDFQVGSWNVRHRRLLERLKGCSDWEDFEGTSTMAQVLGGNGNIEDNLLHISSGSYRAIAIRSFDPAQGKWAIWWLDSRAPHQLDVPVIGSFSNGTGTFLARDTLDGADVLIRFLWLQTATPTPRWEQAMSLDNGANWETNWTMDFSRQSSV